MVAMSWTSVKTYNRWLCLLLASLFVTLMIAELSPIWAQPQKHRDRLDDNELAPKNVYRIFRDNAFNEPNPFGINDGPDLCPPNPPPPEMEFYLNWTNYEVHRVNDDSGLRIILRGRVRSSVDLYWQLTSVAPEQGGPPHLYFLEDIFGREVGEDIELHWQIKIYRNGMWTNWYDMTVNQNNSISTIFPASDCIYPFRVKITGQPRYHHGDGHYKLELDQVLLPIL